MPGQGHRYTMRISRLTIDKLGINMYDKVHAVLAELIANAYDADARQVTITLPLDTYLARKVAGRVEDQGFEVKIEDDGHGMTWREVNDYYLQVGINRRSTRGDFTPGGRRVMGRKGIGKLAPFGICREIEVITSGGPREERGYPVCHLILRYDDITQPTDIEYHPEPGKLDGTYRSTTGTTIILRRFDRRRVPPATELNRLLAARFGLQRSDWEVKVVDSGDPNNAFVIGSLEIDKLEGTEIRVEDRPVPIEGGEPLPVRGWIAYAKDYYKDEAMVGVRIFARGKLVAQTAAFDVPAGFTGEFKLRSYLVGEVHADWLDEEEDLVRSDRQDIIWTSERGQALKAWGQELIKELAKAAEASHANRVWELFLETSKLEERLAKAAPHDSRLRDSVIRAAKALVRRNDREAIEKDPEYVENVVGLAFSIGPHQDLLQALHDASTEAASTLDVVLSLFNKANVAEMYSLGQVANERVHAVKQLSRLIASEETVERNLQALIEKAPWIIDPDWTPLSMNMTLERVRKAFESWYQREHGARITTSTVDNPSDRPDFIMLNNEGRLEIIEIKRPGHALTEEEYDRALGYLSAMRQFLSQNQSIARWFPDAHLTIVCDHIGFTKPAYVSSLRDAKGVTQKTWQEVLDSTMRVHQDFLEVVRRMQGFVAEAAATEEN